MADLELASVVRQLRTELNEAMADAEGQRLRFELGRSAVPGRDRRPGSSAGGKDCFWVVEAGADAKISRETVQDIKLVLTPRDMQAPMGPDGKPAPR